MCKLTQIVGLLMILTGASSLHAQIPAEAFRGVRDFHFRDNDKHYVVRPQKSRMGMFPVGLHSPGKLDWIRQPMEPGDKPFAIHQIDIRLNESKEVVTSIEKEAIVYDLTGKDGTVRHRLPDERWGQLWREESHAAEDANGKRYEFRYLRTTEGVFKGWYLTFEEEPIKVPGLLGRDVDFFPTRLTKEPSTRSQLLFDGGHRSDVAP